MMSLIAQPINCLQSHSEYGGRLVVLVAFFFLFSDHRNFKGTSGECVSLPDCLTRIHSDCTFEQNSSWTMRIAFDSNYLLMDENRSMSSALSETIITTY